MALASHSAIQDRIGNELFEDDDKHDKWNICHIWERYDPNNLWELFGNFRSDGNKGCFTT